MPEIILSTAHTIERFVPYTAPTFEALVAEMNANHEGMASVVQLGQAQDGSWFALVDRALKVILTLEDVMGMRHDQENDDTSEAVLRNQKINMSA